MPAYSEATRRDAYQARFAERLYFDDEEPETRSHRDNDRHEHLTDGYCDHANCLRWVCAD